MSTNKYRNHVIVYAEDNHRIKGATVKLAHAWFNTKAGSVFDRGKALIKHCQGWRGAVQSAVDDNQLNTSKGAHRRIVILVDFDGANRLQDIKDTIAREVPFYADKFYVVGWSGKIEELKVRFDCAGKGFEKLAGKLVEDCQSGCHGIWNENEFNQMREMMDGNKSELQRLKDDVLPLIRYAC